MPFEDLGDMLTFPEGLTEKRGLRLAQTLRGGAEVKLGIAPDKRRGGRPKTSGHAPGREGAETLHTSAGITIRHQQDREGLHSAFCR